MTLRNPPTFLQAGQHPAENTRLALSGLLGSPQGVFAGGVISDSVADGDPGHGRVHPDDFRVSENGTPDMSVDVAAGAAWIRGTESATQGSYHAISDATVNLAIGAAEAANTRFDLVVLRVKDADYSGSDDEVVLEVVAGTPAGTPADPAVPDNSLVLARVTVTALASSIVDADIDNFSITPVGFRFAGRIIFDTVGTANFSKGDYPWLRAVHVRVQAGGGAGGGAPTTGAGEVSAGTGGSGGGYAESFLLASALGATETVTIGAGGTGVNNGGGNDGGGSSFGSLVVTGGGRGGGLLAAASTNATFAGVGGGAATVGDILIPGDSSEGCIRIPPASMSGNGGSSVLGSSGRGGFTNVSGFAGFGFGGGGGGARRHASNTANLKGGDGAPGVVIVDLYT